MSTVLPWQSSGVSATLIGALAILRADAPDAYRAVAREIGGFRIQVTVSGESMILATDRDAIVVLSQAGAAAQATVVLERGAIFTILDGHKTIMQAVLARDLFVAGELPVLARLSRAVSLFAGAALGCRRMRGLLNDFRRESDRMRA